jgi:serine/threonine protein kinase
MGREYKAGEECVPGYRLAKFLGRGGFGEVWRAVGPGRTEVALKLIALDRKQGMKEFRSLRLVKRIHHPNLVPILAFWLIDANGTPLDDESIDLLGSNLLDTSRQIAPGSATMQFNVARAEQLIIAMGLGEKNLLDVLKEYQAKGLAGIPLDELLDFMEGSARAIDFLNTARHDLGGPQPVAIQHCDIKPQNIMLVGDAVQVCDFGLARSLSDVRSTSVAASIAYGAPELFWENKPTHATDQYSLAITYYELRTGHLPFGPDSAAIEVMQAHRDGNLDLHHLNDAERAVIKRATDPSPSGRFERTMDMVRALQRAAHGGMRPLEGPSRATSVGMRSSFVHTGREIVPGSTLLEHLFHPDARTDVWSASSARGNPQAMWLYDLASMPGSIDREALKLIQSLTDHPRVARLSGWWFLNAAGEDVTADTAGRETAITPATLAIASELTRTNLAHRVEECRQFRGKGIPIEELLAYVQQVAEGVDALNDSTHALRGSKWVSLVHTDLRPANLLRFGNSVKIANFAWCRMLDGDEAELAGMPARTPRPTMAPELAAGRIHRRTDQYSLAASYVQMRTGNLLLESGLPTGAASGAVANSTLDFSALSESETEIVQRAMHSDPSERFASCRKMVAELALAAKRVPVGVVETVYPAAVGSMASPSVGAGTLMAGDLLVSSLREKTTMPMGQSPHDTKPDVRKTLEEEALPVKPRRRRLPLVAAAGLLLAAVAGGLLTGTQTEAEVDRLIAEGEYKPAIEAIQSPLWRRWRSDPEKLRGTVISNAEEALTEHAKKGDIDAALDILTQLKPKLVGVEQERFRQHVFSKAIDYATVKIGDEKYSEAHSTYVRLKAYDPENAPTIKLGEQVWRRWKERIAALVDRGNFLGAAKVFQQLDLSDDERVAGEELNIQELKTQIIAAGIKAMTEAQNPEQTIKALDVAEQFKTVKSFAGEAGVSKAVTELVSRAVTVAQADLVNNKFDDAKDIQVRLSQLDGNNIQVRGLSKQVLDAELDKAKSRLADKNWEAALAEYNRVRESWPENDELANEVFDQFQGEIVQVGKQDFDESISGKKADDLERAKEISAVLDKSFHDNAIVKAMGDEVAVLSTHRDDHLGAMLTPEQMVTRLLDQAEQNIRLRVLDDAKKNLAEADKKIDAELPTRADLHRRSIVAHAYLAWQQKDWQEADTWLGQLKAADFAGQAAQLTRYHLLRALVPPRYDGGALAEDADLDVLSQAVEALRKADPKWEESSDRLMANRAKDLCRELGLQVVGLIGSTDAKQQSLGQLVRDRIDNKYWPEDVELLIAINNLSTLLKSADTASRVIQKSLDDPTFDRQRIPDQLLPRLAESFARWGHENKEVDAADAAMAWIGSLKQTDDVRRVAVGLRAEQIRRAAAQDKIDWKSLADRCRRADDDITAAGMTEQVAFVKACLAECLLEQALASSSSVPPEALAEIEAALKATVSDDDQPYVDYVAFQVSQTTGRAIAGKDRTVLAESLCAAYKSASGILDNPVRRVRASELLFGAARGLIAMDASDDPLLPPTFGQNKDQADRAFRWLSEAKELDEAANNKPSDDLCLLLAVAAAEKNDPQQSLANSLLGELCKAPSPSGKVLLIAARSLEKSAPDEAVRRYADALLAMLAIDNTRYEAIYDQVVAPGLKIVESLDAKQLAAVAKQAALLYANKGRSIRLDAAVDSKVFEATQVSGSDAIFDAYDKAIKLDAKVPDYYIQRGTARYNTSSANNNVESLKRDDIEPARRLLGGKETPGFHGLTGVANLLDARGVSSPERGKRVEFYKKAVVDAAKAVDDADPQSEDYPQFLLLHSMACLELANFDTDPDAVIRNYLDSAVVSARKAIADGRGAHPEFSYQALGNAEEDYGLLLRDYNGYRKALQDFDDARLKAIENLSPTNEAQICLGRARYRLATCGAETTAASETLLSSGLADLQAAIDSGRLAPARLAEAYWWKSQIHAARMQKPSERAAANDDLQECLRRVDENGTVWPVYQLYFAGLAAKPEDVRRRARAVLDSSSSKADAAQRVQALQMIANSYLKSGATNEQVRQQLDQGFAEYQRYLPWLPDVAKAQSNDVPGLLALTEFILFDRTYWKGKAELCKASGERALALATGLGAADMAARARADLANHALYVATNQSAIDLAALRKSADQFKAAVDFDDKLATAPVTAIERQSIRNSLAPNWRYALAKVDGSLATDPRTTPAERLTLKAEALKALDGAKDLPESYKKLFKEYRKKLLEIR